MEPKFCWKCREYLEQKYGPNFYMAPSNHCHHPEPEEKPKVPCWCDKPSFKYVQVFGRGIDIDLVEPQFCPVCGRAKKEWGK